jgi:hypothetical protein
MLPEPVRGCRRPNGQVPALCAQAASSPAASDGEVAVVMDGECWKSDWAPVDIDTLRERQVDFFDPRVCDVLEVTIKVLHVSRDDFRKIYLGVLNSLFVR